MALTSRVATLVMSGATGSRTWQATAAVQDTFAGTSVTITVTNSTTGLTPPAVEDNLDLGLYIDDTSTLVRSFLSSLTPGAASQTVTFYFTNDGTSGGAARCGLLRMRLRVNKTTGGPTNTYDINTEPSTYGSPANTAQATFSVTQADVGYIRGTTYATVDMNNLAYGKTVTGSGATIAGVLSNATNGEAMLGNYVAIATTAGTQQWIQVDLGAVYTIDTVRVWHYWLDGRTNTLPETQVSVDGVNWTSVATPAAYAESINGHTRTFNQVSARYVRDLISVSVFNSAEWIEIQVGRKGAYVDALNSNIVLGDTPYKSYTLSQTFGGLASVSSPSSNTTVFTVSQGSVDNRFPASSGNKSTVTSVPNASLVAIAWTSFGRLSENTSVIDPRLTATPLFQLDDNTFGTPPMSKDVPSHLRQSTQQAFLASRFTNSRGEGINGLTYDLTLTPTKPGSAVSQTGKTTVTQGGQLGWSNSFTAWSSSLPGGTWTKAVTITAPANIVGASYVILASGANNTYTLISKDPNLDVRMSVQHISGYGGRHFSAGMSLIPSAYLIDVSNGMRIAASQITSAVVSVVRPSTAANPDGSGVSWEYLDNTGAWVTWNAVDPVYSFPMSQSTVDSTTFERVFTSDSTWGTRDIRFNVTFVYQGVTYFVTYIVINVSTKNMHDSYVFDGAGFIGFPSK